MYLEIRSRTQGHVCITTYEEDWACERLKRARLRKAGTPRLYERGESSCWGTVGWLGIGFLVWSHSFNSARCPGGCRHSNGLYSRLNFSLNHIPMRREGSLTLVSYPATSSDWICISTPPSLRGSFLLGRCATYITPERTLIPKQSTSCIKVQHGVLVSLYWLSMIYRSRDLHHPSQVVSQGSWTLGFLYSLQV